MPNLNEFFHRPEILKKDQLETIHGIKPCSKCDSNAEEAFWDPNTLTLAWQCPNGHHNQYRIN